jgi:sulfopyruvate decarboxylase subunit beta
MMTLREALEIVADQRGRRIVVATMSSAGEWPSLSDTALALGLALAQPERGVLVLNGDGCTLMNLGCLVTLANHPANVYLLIVENRLYEVTGGQATAGADRVDFAGLARAAGIERVYSFDNADAWRAAAAEALNGAGPVVVCLKVEGRIGQKTPKAPRPMAEQLERLRSAL